MVMVMMTVAVVSVVVMSMMVMMRVLWHFLIFLISFLAHFFMDSCEDSSWNVFRLYNFNEGVLMLNTVFADFTEVEVLANRALVSNTDDWRDSAAITSDIQMCLKCKFWSGSC